LPGEAASAVKPAVSPAAHPPQPEPVAPPTEPPAPVAAAEQPTVGTPIPTTPPPVPPIPTAPLSSMPISAVKATSAVVAPVVGARTEQRVIIEKYTEICIVHIVEYNWKWRRKIYYYSAGGPILILLSTEGRRLSRLSWLVPYFYKRFRSAWSQG